MSKVTLSVVVTGFPPQLRQPKPLPGETPAQLIIRNHPHEWRNCVDRLASDFGATKETCERLLRGRIGPLEENIRDEVQWFMAMRMPCHGRTLKGLAELKKLNNEKFQSHHCFSFEEILWPREQDPNGSTESDSIAAKFGIHVIPFPLAESREMNIAGLLPHLRADFVWFVPGGTSVMPMVLLSLEMAMRQLSATSKRALFADNKFSVVFRTAALREQSNKGQPLATEVREIARQLRSAGYDILMDDRLTLCELEPEFGGPREGAETELMDHRPLWRKLLGI